LRNRNRSDAFERRPKIVTTSMPQIARVRKAIRNGRPMMPNTIPTTHASLGSVARNATSARKPNEKTPVSAR